MSRKPLDLEHRRPLPEWLEAAIGLLAITILILTVYVLAGGWG